jgi:hypothetical protein
VKFKGVDRAQAPHVPGDLVKQWTAEMDAELERLRRYVNCPNCGMCCSLLSATCDPRVLGAAEPNACDVPCYGTVCGGKECHGPIKSCPHEPQHHSGAACALNAPTLKSGEEP